MTTLPNGWLMVVGLEVHTELKTATKLFCGCANHFGSEPNTNICPVCLGLPGSMPVLNERAVDLAMAIGFALNCRIQASTFHRKNYFYPDMPKDYQVSQYDLPINADGYLDLPDGSRVSIVRAHMEEDTGKTTHLGSSGRIHGADRSLVDYNRSGVPLVEIVSGPDIRSSAQARAYVAELRAILVTIGASDGRMEEGSLRVDANVSVHQPGTPFGTRCEIKNLNSLRSLQRAIDYEALRQIDVLESGGSIRQETRHWDENDGRTHTLRTKEDADDYRYFLEPDLVPLVPSVEWVEQVRSAVPAIVTGLAPTVLTFDPHPRVALGNRVDLISTLERRLELLGAQGVETTLIAGFTPELLRLSPEDFAETYLRAIGAALRRASRRRRSPRAQDPLPRDHSWTRRCPGPT